MYDEQYCRYYDLIHKEKDYAGEIRVVLDVYSRHAKRPLHKVLDVGCGTGGHMIALAEAGLSVIGVDAVPEMIAIARNKVASMPSLDIALHTGDIAHLDEKSFDLAVSLFYVVNHIRSIRDLVAFFRAISDRIAEGGIYVFDCWNGVAAIRDLPRDDGPRKFTADGLEVTVQMRADTDLLKQETVVHRFMEIRNDRAAIPEKVETVFRQVLWTPKDLTDTLEMAGLRPMAVTKLYQPDIPATAEDWKIMFVCAHK